MPTNERLVQLVIGQLRATECVPMLGGQGVLLPEVSVPAPGSGRPVCARRRSSPGHAARAYIVLALLGKGSAVDADQSFWGQGAEKYIGGSFVDSCVAWFEQRGVELRRGESPAHMLSEWDALKPRHCWRPMLEALTRLAEGAPGLTPEQKNTVRLAWFEQAWARLSELVKKRRGKTRRTPLAPREGLVLLAADPRWERASRILEVDDGLSALLQAAYCLHVFNASLGFWQIGLHDDRAARNRRQARRVLFHRELLTLIRHACLLPQLRHGAARIAAALARTPLFDIQPPQDTPAVCVAIPAGLPACFGAYDGLGVVHLADAESQTSGAVAKAHIVEAHQLGEMLADQMLDALRVRRAPDWGPGFSQDCYAYAVSRFRYRRHEAAKLRCARAEADPTVSATDNNEEYARMMEAYFGHIGKSHIAHIVRQHLGDVHRSHWGAADPGSACAMCHVQTPDRRPE